MPLTEKGEEIKSAMAEEYGAKKGGEVFYASKNKGTISGVDAAGTLPEAHLQGSSIPPVVTAAEVAAANRAFWEDQS